MATVLDDVGQANGMGFSPDCRRFYLTDTRQQRIDVFDYDVATGAIANRRIFVAVPGEQGKPDGLVVDAQGYVWSALWGGGCLVRYRPDGNVERQIALPPKKVSSAAFGGPGYGDLYVTTAGGDDPQEGGTGAGGVFRVALGSAGIRGRPIYRSRVRV